MPIATAAAIAGGIAVAGGAAKAISGASQAKKYSSLIDSYQRQKLDNNPYDNLRVSTLGAMLQQQNAAQNTATAMYNLRNAGTNAIIGGTGKVVEQNNRVNRQISAGLDQQAARNELYSASGAMQLIRMKERREENDLAGLGTALNAGRQTMWGGFGDMATGASVMAGGLKGGAGSGAFGAMQNDLSSSNVTDMSGAIGGSYTAGVDWTKIG